MELDRFTKKVKEFFKKLNKKPSDPSLTVPIFSAASSSSSSSIKPSDLEFVSILDNGKSATVHHVRHRPTGQSYALKIMHSPRWDTIRRQIYREIHILRDVDSPFIVKYHGDFEQDIEIKILLEYMDGGHIGLRGRIAEPTLSKFARQILLGLTYLHRKKIIHCDIKPPNILINGQDQVKICDFGLSFVLTGKTGICKEIGSQGAAAYMSPERMKAVQHQTGFYDGYASDIWSFGVSVLECYLGRHPFKRSNQDEKSWHWTCVMYALNYEEPPEMPADASEEFKSFVMCCLRKEPSARWTAEKLLEHPFIIMHQDVVNTEDLIDKNAQAASSSSSKAAKNPRAASSSSSKVAKNPRAASFSSSKAAQKPPPPRSSSKTAWNPQAASSSSSKNVQNPQAASSSSSKNVQNPQAASSSSSSSKTAQNPQPAASSSSSKIAQNPQPAASSSSSKTAQNPQEESSSSSKTAHQ